MYEYSSDLSQAMERGTQEVAGEMEKKSLGDLFSNVILLGLLPLGGSQCIDELFLGLSMCLAEDLNVPGLKDICRRALPMEPGLKKVIFPYYGVSRGNWMDVIVSRTFA